MYRAARAALLAALSDEPPGLTQAEMIDATKRHLPETLFPGGAKAGATAKLFTSTNASNGPMQALLAKTGFEPSRTVHNVDPGDPELISVRFLRPQGA